MPLLIVVAVVLIAGITWRARVTRRLTIEESVDNYRRTLSAVHEAATRSRESDGDAPIARPMAERTRGNRDMGYGAPGARRRLIVAAMAAATVVAVVVVVATTTHSKRPAKNAAPTTTRPPATHPRATTTTTVAAPTTTAPLLTADPTGTQFTIGKPSYTLAVQTASGSCWVDMRNPAGTALFTGTLSPGATQSVTATDVTLKLGNPGTAKVTIDGTPVAFTVSRGSPVSLHFHGTPAA